jgi:hypothetical protein
MSSGMVLVPAALTQQYVDDEAEDEEKAAEAELDEQAVTVVVSVRRPVHRMAREGHYGQIEAERLPGIELRRRGEEIWNEPVPQHHSHNAVQNHPRSEHAETGHELVEGEVDFLLRSLLHC